MFWKLPLLMPIASQTYGRVLLKWVSLRCRSTKQRKAPYTLSVKLSDFTVWRHTWRKNWVNWAVLTGNSAGLRTVFPVVFHIGNCAVHSGNPTVSSVYLPTPRWHTHEKTHRTDKPDGKPVLCQRTFSSVFRAVFLRS